MKVDRRSLIKMLAAAAGATALGWYAPDLLGNLASMGHGKKEILIPSDIPKYAHRLVKPPSFIPDPLTGIFNASASEFTHRALPATDGSGRSTGYGPTTAFGFGGLVRNEATGRTEEFRSVPGPTFETLRGVPIQVWWKNEIRVPYMLPVDPTLHWANPNKMEKPLPPFKAFPPGYPEAQSPVPLVVHLHGGQTEPPSDGQPEAWYTPDGRKGPTYIKELYSYDNLQQATTLWYHDHAMGITRLNVYVGLLGFYIIRDREDKIAPLLPSGEYEIPLAIQDCAFYETDDATGHNELYYPTVGVNPDVHPYWKGEVISDVITVNGRAWPNLDVDRGQYRFRLLNGSPARFYNLFFSNGMEFIQIGSDGGYLMAPVKRKTLFLAPAERADILVDFSNTRPGDKIILQNNAIAPYPAGKAPDENTAGQVMRFTVTDRPGFGPNKLPSALNPTLAGTAFPTLAPGEVTRTLALTRVIAPHIMFLDGQSWSAPLSEAPVNGTTEDWVVANVTHATHPIHVHLIMFQLVSRQEFDKDAYAEAWALANDAGSPDHLDLPLKKPTVKVPVEPYLKGSPRGPEENERGWKDTVKMNPGEVTRIRLRFTAQDGSPFPFDPAQKPGYIWHCHILGHGDNEMMRPYRVIKK